MTSAQRARLVLSLGITNLVLATIVLGAGGFELQQRSAAAPPPIAVVPTPSPTTTAGGPTEAPTPSTPSGGPVTVAWRDRDAGLPDVDAARLWHAIAARARRYPDVRAGGQRDASRCPAHPGSHGHPCSDAEPDPHAGTDGRPDASSHGATARPADPATDRAADAAPDAQADPKPTPKPSQVVARPVDPTPRATRPARRGSGRRPVIPRPMTPTTPAAMARASRATAPRPARPGRAPRAASS